MEQKPSGNVVVAHFGLVVVHCSNQVVNGQLPALE
jgi:hypothetical protein